MSEIEAIERDYVGARFRTSIRNAKTKLTNNETLLSKTFIFRDIPWNISLQTYRIGGSQAMISCYLNCLETDPGFSFKASYKFAAIRASGQPFEKQNTTTFDGNVNFGRIRDFFSLAELSRLSEGYIFDGALTIEVELKEELASTLAHHGPKQKLIHSLQSSTTNDLIKDVNVLLESGDGDVTFQLKDGTIKAHKSILCVRNAIFATMLSVDMKEAKTMKVTIGDMGKDALKILLLHIYTGQLSLPEELDLDGWKEVVNAAEKYNLPELKEVAGMALVELVMKTSEDAFEHYKFLKSHNVDAASKALVSYFMSNTKEGLDKC